MKVIVNATEVLEWECPYVRCGYVNQDYSWYGGYILRCGQCGKECKFIH